MIILSPPDQVLFFSFLSFKLWAWKAPSEDYSKYYLSRKSQRSTSTSLVYNIQGYSGARGVELVGKWTEMACENEGQRSSRRITTITYSQTGKKERVRKRVAELRMERVSQSYSHLITGMSSLSIALLQERRARAWGPWPESRTCVPLRTSFTMADIKLQ